MDSYLFSFLTGQDASFFIENKGFTIQADTSLLN